LPAITIVFGALLVLVGLVGFFGTGGEHPTALIPAGPGLLFAVLGALSFKDGLRKHTMHVAAALGLLGFLGTGIRCVPALARLLSGERLERPAAFASEAVTAALCAAFVGLCVNSFIQARRRRSQAPPEQPVNV
jgi:hypothetical protein